MTNTKDRTLLGVFTTACEGGIIYWANIDKYRWTLDKNPLLPDYDGFKAALRDEDDTEFVINRKTIEEGIDELAKRLVGNDLTLSSYQTAAILELWKIVNARESDYNLDYDADTADLIVQQGLFGEIIYG